MPLPSVERPHAPRFDPVQIMMIAAGVILIFAVAAML
jgi:hypothetical protein